MATTRRITRIRGTLQAAVEDSVAAMGWLTQSDKAVVVLALKYATEIDKAGDDQRAIGYLGQQLMGAMRALGGTPAERRALDAEGTVGGKLAELRKARQRRTAAVDAPASGLDA